MIIDLILNRKEGATYTPKGFYNSIMRYYAVFPEMAEPIANALDGGEERDVKNELCRYIKEQKYNLNICSYINRVGWLKD